jgi:nitrite reductase (NO-forming)
MADGRMVFIGVGGEIDGAVNPDLHVHPGDHVRLVLENGDGMPHDLAIPDLFAQSPMVSSQGERAELIFKVGEDNRGTFPYFCTVIGHRQAGMEGKLVVGNEAE